MKRKIKFRAKALTDRKWRYGYVSICDDFCIIDQNNECYIDKDYDFRGDTHFFRIAGAMCDKESVGQYTGRHDKNGKEIYEKDIVRFGGFIGKPDFDLGVVEWFDRLCAFVVHPIDKPNLYVLCKDYSYTIVGNVYDNPELIKKEE